MSSLATNFGLYESISLSIKPNHYILPKYQPNSHIRNYKRYILGLGYTAVYVGLVTNWPNLIKRLLEIYNQQSSEDTLLQSELWSLTGSQTHTAVVINSALGDIHRGSFRVGLSCRTW